MDHLTATDLATWATVAAGVVGSAWALRKKIGVDSVELKRRASDGELDAAENLSKTHWIERQDQMLRDVQKRNEECQAENAELRGRVQHLTERVNDQSRELHRIKNMLFTLRPEFRQVLDSEFGQLEKP